MTMEQKMHELLCAYALGEVDAAQRIEVERALAASPELRGELERIEDTIGLVRESLGGGETMSKEAEKALMSAVNPEPPRVSWYSNGWMRMAASVLVVGGGAIWMHRLYECNTKNMSSSQLALLEKEEARKAEPNGSVTINGGVPPQLLAQLDEKNKDRGDFYDLKVLRPDGTVVPGQQTNLWAGAGGSGGGDSVTTNSFPTTPFGAEAKGGSLGVFQPQARVPAEKPAMDMLTLNDDAGLSKDAAGLPPIVTQRESIDPANSETTVIGVAHSGHRAAAPGTLAASKPAGRAGGELGDKVGKGTYKGAGDTVASGTPATDASSRPAGPATGSPAAKSGEELGLAYRARKSGLDDAKERTEGKAKQEELAKQVGQFMKNKKADAPAAGSDDFFVGQASAQTPADEAQVRLRRLLDRADSAEAERMARLKGGLEPGQNFQFRGSGGPPDEDMDDEVSLRELYFKLTPEQRAALLEQECRRVFDGCRRLPNERPRDMFFRYWGDNPFEITALDPLSTFSADVDTASYALARRYLVEGKLPEKAQIRTEEFVNYFKADVAAPTKGTFAIHTDLAPSRFAQPANSTWMLRVVVRGKELPKEERKPLHLTCVIDCSGSMREQNRMETVKDTLRLLLTQLNSADMVGIVAFSTEARQILPLTSVANRGLIEVAIQQLAPDGWTNSEAGLKLGYETALAGLDAHATNRVVFLSDGVANQGVTDPVQLSESLKPIREKGVYLNTIGVGMNNHNDTLLEQLADKGDGMCSYVDDMREAKRVMMDNFMGSVETIARDVKIQVDFDPAQVTRYRLLGYENRAIADADFRNDKVDAGEVGSGHQVTALYEIERNLAVTGEKPLATVRLRYKAPRIVNGPANEEATEIAQEVRGNQQTSFEGADAGYRRAVIVGQFAEFLRRSVNARGRSLDELLAEAHKLEAQIPQDADFHEFVALAERSKQLVLSNLPGCDELCQAIDAYRTWQFQCAQAERLSHERQQQIVEDLARQNRDMEEKIRELLRRRLESTPK